MKRSMNVENIAVVMALGIALSLLATACGPGKLKTIKNGKFAAVVEKQENNILKAAVEKRTADLDAGPQAPVDSIAVQDLAKRLLFVSLRELSETTANLTIQVKTASGIPYYLTFIEPHVGVDSQNNKTITFSKNIARKVVSATEVSKTAETLPFSAQIKVIDKNQSIVSIYEKNGKTTTEVAAMVRLSDAVAALNSATTGAQALSDATYKVRITQLYMSDDNVLQGKINYLDSNSNRVVITLSSHDFYQTTSKPLLSLSSKIDPNSNTTPLKITYSAESIRKLMNDKTVATLTSGDAVIKSDILAIAISQPDSTVAVNITLTLVKESDKKSDDMSDNKFAQEIASDDNSKDSSKPTAEQIKAAESRQYDISTSLTPVEKAAKEKAISELDVEPVNVVAARPVVDLEPVNVTAPPIIDLEPVNVTAPPIIDLEPVNVTATIPKDTAPKKKLTVSSVLDSVSNAMTMISEKYKEANDKTIQDNKGTASKTAIAPN